jgi:hypothetical protein
MRDQLIINGLKGVILDPSINECFGLKMGAGGNSSCLLDFCIRKRQNKMMQDKVGADSTSPDSGRPNLAKLLWHQRDIGTTRIISTNY